MYTNPKTTLLFTESAAPSAIDVDLAHRIGAGVLYRNAQYVAATDRLEKCDYVAGAIPATYSEVPVHPEQGGAQGDLPLSGASTLNTEAPQSVGNPAPTAAPAQNVSDWQAPTPATNAGTAWTPNA